MLHGLSWPSKSTPRPELEPWGQPCRETSDSNFGYHLVGPQLETGVASLGTEVISGNDSASKCLHYSKSILLLL